jgi:hypothetical protein
MYRKEDEVFYQITSAELTALLLKGEADGESVEGKKAVIHVLNNRLKIGGWFRDKGIYAKLGNNPLTAIILKNALVKGKYIYQFSCFQEGDPNRIKLLTDAKNRVFKYLPLVLTTWEESRYPEPPYWAERMIVTAEIGNHIFMKDKV